MIGKTFANKNGHKFTVIQAQKDIRGKTVYVIKFIESDYIKENVYARNIRLGIVKDPFQPTVCGVGFIGNAEYKGNEKVWHIWRSILKRCYDKKATDYKSYGMKGVQVCKRWHSFEYFLNDIKNIDGYDESLFINGKLELDKDLKSGEIKIYSIENCIFLSREENQAIAKENTGKSFIAFSPTGEKFKERNIAKFAKNHGLTAPIITLCLQGKYSHHKGWKFYNTEEEVDYNGQEYSLQ